MTKEAHSAEAIRDELKKILESKTFRKCEKLFKILRHIVEVEIDGKGDGLTFDNIAEALQDTKNALQANLSRLRQRLSAYYDCEEGCEDIVIIVLPRGKGKARPEFHHGPPKSKSLYKDWLPAFLPADQPFDRQALSGIEDHPVLLAMRERLRAEFGRRAGPKIAEILLSSKPEP